jgi:hypothetical protein
LFYETLQISVENPSQKQGADSLQAEGLQSNREFCKKFLLKPLVRSRELTVCKLKVCNQTDSFAKLFRTFHENPNLNIFFNETLDIPVENPSLKKQGADSLQTEGLQTNR